MRSAAQGGKKEGAREAVSFAVGEHRCELGEGLVRAHSTESGEWRQAEIAINVADFVSQCLYGGGRESAFSFLCVLANGSGVW